MEFERLKGLFKKNMTDRLGEKNVSLTIKLGKETSLCNVCCTKNLQTDAAAQVSHFMTKNL